MDIAGHSGMLYPISSPAPVKREYYIICSNKRSESCACALSIFYVEMSYTKSPRVYITYFMIILS